MARDRRSVVWSAVGAVAGVAGLVASRCAGGGCSTCFACAVPGLSAVALAVLNRRPVAVAAPVTRARRG